MKHVILNRTAMPKAPYAGCHDIISNVLQPYQFSSFLPSDPNASRLPNPKSATDYVAWKEICELVDSDTQDNTGGANYYFSVDIAPPAWADPIKETVRIGAFRFFKL